MNTIIKLAWRNLWRSKRRTMITVASVFFGVFFAVFVSSVQNGSFENILDNMLRFYSGYMQIQHKDYMENRSLNNSFEDSSELEANINSDDNISNFASRIESFALSAYGDKTYGTLVFGIQPEKENEISQVAKWVKKGNYLNEGSNSGAVLVGSQLAENLNIGVNDTLVLIGQGYHGATAAGKFPVAGLLDFPLPDLNKQMVYMDIHTARQFYSMPGRSTSLIMMVKNADNLDKTISNLQSQINGDLKVYSWKEIQPELENFIQGKLAGGKIMKGILFMVIGFGIWGTIIMMMAERRRELGVMIALGVRKTMMISIVAIESFFIGLLGAIAGAMGSLPLVLYFFYNPIHVTGQMKETYESMGFEPVLKFSIKPDNFISPAITVFILFAVITIYAVWFIGKLKTAKALRA